MMKTVPAFCRPTAFATMQAELSAVDNARGLFRAAWTIALHEYPESNANDGEATVRRLAEAVRTRAVSGSRSAMLAHLHDVMFDIYGLHGNEDDYYDARNSYLPCVLEQRCGIPITLTLLYKSTAAQLGIEVYGVNAPGHFLAEVPSAEGCDGPPMYVDPFFGGSVLSRDEALQRIAQATGRPIDQLDGALSRATHREWIVRMLNNLQAIFARAGRERDLLAMQELQQLVLA